ncbi:DUF6566 family protein [Paraburkholderia susongensis]|uniref:DUF6566 domain-containing protein n=1 Tax=Paraburkholderia susongensis TaxID=1515439 RepID=A0A1X7LZH0_9BURK|nr:DUF6566 family protein [Paraburkholderia susongensis]SMG58867.1 hypothetical protein SAMN06265784_11213 [Paraburkholderia susongensis]
MAQHERIDCHGFDITAHSRCNRLGGWIAHVDIYHNGRLFATCNPDTVQPEWQTEAEANRDGIERGCKFIGGMMNDPHNRSWVAARAHAEKWFFRIEELQESERIALDALVRKGTSA